MNYVPLAMEHSVAISSAYFWKPTTITCFPLTKSLALSSSKAAYSIACKTFPSNTSGPLPMGNSGLFGRPVNFPTHNITKSTSYSCLIHSLLIKINIYPLELIKLILKLLNNLNDIFDKFVFGLYITRSV